MDGGSVVRACLCLDERELLWAAGPECPEICVVQNCVGAWAFWQCI